MLNRAATSARSTRPEAETAMVANESSVDPARSAPSSPAWPGEELVSRVAGGTDRESFFESGRQSVRDIEAVLAVKGRALDSYERILDFGCGCGRILLWLEHLAGRSLHGVDIDGRAIVWAREHIPFATFQVNQPLPPLDYPDSSFDLVYNHSVFTHIDETYQDAWLSELRRVTRPGGHALLSVHGEEAFFQFAENSVRAGGDPDRVRDTLSRDGICFIKEDSWVGGPFPDFYHSTFHAPWYVFEHWGRYFNILAYVPGGSLGLQDFVLLERPLPGREGEGARAPLAVIRGGNPDKMSGDRVSPAASSGGGESERMVPSSSGDLLRTAKGVVGKLIRRAAGEGGWRPGQRPDAVSRAVSALDDRVGTETEVWRRSLGEVSELTTRLWDAVARQGERINRLEADLWKAIRESDAQGTHGDATGRKPGRTT